MANDAILNKEAEEKDNARFQELNKIVETERTEEQKKELGELKERHSTRVEKRINQITAKQKEAEEKAERLERENEELKKKIPGEKEPPVSEGGKDEVVEISGKKYFTDKALMVQVKAGEITEDEAYAYQRKRDKEEVKAEMRQENDEKDRKDREITLRKEDSDRVLKEYPHFSKKSPDFNPEDPLYKLANELYTEAYAANPKGLSLSIKRAKEILRISDEHIDRSDDTHVEDSNPPDRNKGGEKEITLSENEKEAAVRQFTRGDVINPKTGKPYTTNEALAKALQAKKDRSR